MLSVRVSGKNFSIWMEFAKEEGFIQAIRSYIRKGYKIEIPAEKEEQKMDSFLSTTIYEINGVTVNFAHHIFAETEEKAYNIAKYDAEWNVNFNPDVKLTIVGLVE